MDVESEEHNTDLKEKYSQAILKVSEGLAHDEASHTAEATHCYHDALNLINDALRNATVDLGETDEHVRRLNELRKQVLVRIADIDASARQPDSRPASTSSSAETAGHLPTFYQAGVELFHVLNDGRVEKEQGSYDLELVTLQDEHGSSSFVRVGEWVYPLVHGVSLVWTNEDGAYIFPAIDGSTTDGYIGVTFPPETKESRAVFEMLLKELTTAQPVILEESKPVSQSIASALELGGQTVGSAAVRGAEFAGEWIIRGGSWLRSQISRTTEPTQINPHLQTGITVAKGVTGVAVKATEFLATQVGTVTVAAGRFLAPHIREYGTSLVARMTGSDPAEAAVKVDGALVVAGGAVSGVSSAYHGLETAGRVLAASMASSTVTIVQHRHGSQAAALTSNSLLTLLNLVETGKNVSTLGVKGVAKKMAKSTGKAVVGK